MNLSVLFTFSLTYVEGRKTGIFHLPFYSPDASKSQCNARPKPGLENQSGSSKLLKGPLQLEASPKVQNIRKLESEA